MAIEHISDRIPCSPSKTLIGLAAFVTLLVTLDLGVGAVQSDDDSAIVVTPVQDAVLGERALADFLAQRPLSEDGVLFLRVGAVGRRISSVSDSPNLLTRFYVVQGNELQAYSFPGGAVCLTEALSRLFQSDDELAFALAHELAHVVLRHHVAKMRANLLDNAAAPSESALLAIVKNRLERHAEMEADRFGALYAVRAGYRYTASYEALERLSETSPATQGDAAHPDFEARIEALKTFREELERVLVAFDRGVIALERGDPTEAIAMLRLFVAEFPSSLAGRVNLGAAYLAKMRLAAGTPLGLAEPLEIVPTPGILVRGSFDKIDVEQAKTNFELAIRLNPEDPNPRVGLAVVHLRVGDLAEARKHLEVALRQDPANWQLVLCLGNIEYVDENYAAAVSTYIEALSLRPQSTGAMKNLAMAYEKLGRHHEACTSWRLLSDKGLGEATERAARVCGKE